MCVPELSCPLPLAFTRLTLRIPVFLLLFLSAFLTVGYSQSATSNLLEGDEAFPPSLFENEEGNPIKTKVFSLSHSTPGAQSKPLEQKRIYNVAKGPWGDLEYYVIHLHAPLSWMDYVQIPSERTVWNFSSDDPKEVIALVEEEGVTLVGGTHWTNSGEFHEVPGESGLGFLPSPKLIESLNSVQRAGIARVLRKNELNITYREPVVIESGDAVTWYRDAGLEEELVQKIASLCYMRGQSLVFSDVPYIASILDTVDEQKRFIRATTRTRSLVLRLNIGSGEAFEDVADYWNAGYKKKAVLPILEAIAETPGVERLDIAHLLPPTPRKLLYTYPDLRSFLTIGDRDCHWTSFNFFKSEPDGILSERMMSDWLNNKYDPVTGDLKYGDVIMLRNAETGEAIHSATFIAGDIVFTKNGRERLSPWILMRYSDMERRYRLDDGLSASVFRLKDDK